MARWRYECETCGHAAAWDARDWRCPICGGAFVIAGLAQPGGAADRSEQTLWRFARWLPVERGEAASLGEGMTPLVRGVLAGEPVWFKCDHLLPTGSFKDRGAAVLVAHLRRLGLRRVIVDSSGNAAAAMAGYATANGIECVVFAPATTSAGKLVQARAFGATIHLVEGNRDAVAEAAQSAAADDDEGFYASHNWHPVFAEGVKTWALEVLEQLGHAPAAAFIPTGGGSAFAGAALGFSRQLPALVAAQPAACAPIVDAWRQGSDTVAPVTPAATIAEGTRIGAPARQRSILAPLRASRGWAAAVSESEIERALRALWSQGFYVEPTSAVGAAAFIQAAEAGTLPEGARVVLLTGNGLKATETIGKIVSGGE